MGFYAIENFRKKYYSAKDNVENTGMQNATT